MAIIHNKALLGKVLLLTVMVMLLVVMSGLTGLGCIKGLQPIGWSGGVVADGSLFVGSEEGRLVAINIVDGARQWSEPLKASGSTGGCLGPAGGGGCAAATGGGGCAAAPAGVAIYGTPAVAGDLVYIGGYNGKVHAFDSSTLETRWVYPREGYLEPIIGGLVVVQGKVFFGCSDGKVYALDAETGNKEWEPFETGDKIWSTPAIDDETLYIGSFDNKLYALNAADGSQKWKPFETEGAIASTPLIYDNKIYAGSLDRHFYAIDAATGKQIWQFPVNGEAENKPENWFWAKPVAYDNVIYAGCLDGKVYALDAKSGDKLDEFDLGGPVSASPVVVNSSVIFASQPGVIYALDTGNNELRLLVDIEKEVYGPLCASEGFVYIHTQDMTLHPVDANTGAKLNTISLEIGE